MLPPPHPMIEIPLSTSFLLPRQRPLRRAWVLFKGDAGITPSVLMALFLDLLPATWTHLYLSLELWLVDPVKYWSSEWSYMDETWNFVIVQEVLFFRLTHTCVLQTEKKLSTLERKRELFHGVSLFVWLPSDFSLPQVKTPVDGGEVSLHLETWAIHVLHTRKMEATNSKWLVLVSGKF